MAAADPDAAPFAPSPRPALWCDAVPFATAARLPATATASRRPPITIAWRWIETLSSLVELHGLAPGDAVAVVCDEDTDPLLYQAAVLACARTGVAPVGFRLPAGAGTDRLDHAPTLAGLRAASLVLDLADVVERSAWRDVVVADARVVALAPGDGRQVDRVVVHAGLARRADRLADLLAATDAMVVTSPTGATLRVALDGGRRVERGVARPGDGLVRWPGGRVWSSVERTATSGSFVVMPGDLVLEPAHVVSSHVRIEVARGRLVEILGDGPDADLVRSLVERRVDDDALGLREVGLGLGLTRATSTPPATHALGAGATRAGACTLVFGTGAETTSLTLIGATVEIADRPVVDLGRLTGVVAPDVYELAAAE